MQRGSPRRSIQPNPWHPPGPQRAVAPLSHFSFAGSAAFARWSAGNLSLTRANSSPTSPPRRARPSSPPSRRSSAAASTGDREFQSSPNGSEPDAPGLAAPAGGSNPQPVPPDQLRVGQVLDHVTNRPLDSATTASVAHMIRLYAGHDLLHLRQIERVRESPRHGLPSAGPYGFTRPSPRTNE
jgi:hypothetical protein